MSDPLYSKDLLRLAADAHAAGRLQRPHATGVAFNPACGDRVTVDLELAGDRIGEIAMEAKACVLAQASASILGGTLKGFGRSDVERLQVDVRAMLERQTHAPASPFAAYGVFQGAAVYASRHRCVLLPIQAVLNALEAADPNAAGR